MILYSTVVDNVTVFVLEIHRTHSCIPFLNKMSAVTANNGDYA
jgi:hypothetical protein